VWRGGGLKIYLDGMFYRCSGVGRVFENLLSAFIDSSEMEEIATILPASLRETFGNQFPSAKVKPVYVPYGPMGFGDLFRKGRVLRSLVGRVGLFFFPGHNIPFSVPGRYIVSVNDVTVFSPHFEASWVRKTGFRLLLSRAVRGAEKVVTISEVAKADIIREFSVPPEKVRVIYPWVKDIFFQPPPAGPDAMEGEYILFLGLRIPHKNLDGLIQAFLGIADQYPGLRIVIAGSRYSTPDMVDRWRENPRLKGKLVEILDPTDEQIVRLFAGAKVFVFPSFVEGFGLPPLEAMASGVPVVCSDIPVFREVYGEAVCFVDPKDSNSIIDGIRRVHTDPDLAEELVTNGRHQAMRYRRDRSLEGYLGVISKACEATSR
jgi:glycosyltransferase involved in cell wall biosynthesis